MPMLTEYSKKAIAEPPKQEENLTEGSALYDAQRFVRGLDHKRNERGLLGASALALLIICVGAWVLLMHQLPFSLAALAAIGIIASIIFTFGISLPRLLDVIGQHQTKREYIEVLADYLDKQYSPERQEIISAMAENDRKAVQASYIPLAALVTLVLTLMSGSAAGVIPTDYSFVIGFIAILLFPLLYLNNSEQDMEDVVILQAVARCKERRLVRDANEISRVREW
jgi:hypothetical protein